MNDSPALPAHYVAIHEAAHAVIGVLLGAAVDFVTIESDDDAGIAGHVLKDYGDPFQDFGGEDWNLMVRVISAYAGHMATEKLGNHESPEQAGAANDYRDAAFMCDSIAGGDEDRCLELQEQGQAMARLMVELCWS